jgi:hypothetical protein
MLLWDVYYTGGVMDSSIPLAPSLGDEIYAVCLNGPRVYAIPDGKGGWEGVSREKAEARKEQMK